MKQKDSKTIKLTVQSLDPWLELQQHEQKLYADGLQWGAMVNFIGTMRDFNADYKVQTMFLEHYSPMTELHLQRLANTAVQNWNLIDTLIIHRVGEIKPQNTIVLVAAWAAHRAEAFAACSYLIEELKHHAPFWKCETLLDGSQRWVTNNTPAKTTNQEYR
jgi:molybdopterin synthase catalytic subunit